MSNQIVRVAFQGGELEATKENGKVWVSVRRCCESLGIDVEGQRKKLKEKDWAVTEFMSATGPDGKNYQTFMIDLDSFPMWLGTIDASRVKEEVRPMLVMYQKEAARVLRDHFFGKRNAETPEEKEARLWAREKRLATRQRVQGFKLFRKLAAEFQRPELVTTFDVKIAEELSGSSHPELLPAVTNRADWVSPETIAEQYGVTMQRIGLTITKLWGKQRVDIDGVREMRMTVTKHGKQLPIGFYSPDAVHRIGERLADDGHITWDKVA